MPECAVGRWTPFPVLIDAVLVRAAHDAVGHDDRQGALAIDELEDLADNGKIGAHVAGFYLPFSQLRLGAMSSPAKLFNHVPSRA
jgi:hypothetical protein